jgi:hypothetical protein
MAVAKKKTDVCDVDVVRVKDSVYVCRIAC